MNSREQELIESFLNKADPKIAKTTQKFFKQGEDSYCKDDIILGISMPVIKDFVKTVEKIELDTLSGLAISEFNEARILGWALLFRDYNEPSIVKYFADEFAEHCNNWNIVDFAAPLTSKSIIKHEDVKSAEKFAYHLLYKETNLWSHRFALVMAIPMIKAGYLNYAIDSVDRSLHFDDELIQKACGWILREVNQVNSNLFNIYMRENIVRMSPLTKAYAKEEHPK